MKTTESGESPFDMIRRLELAEEDHTVLTEKCSSQGIGFFTAFDFQSFDLLMKVSSLPCEDGFFQYAVSHGVLDNMPI